MTPAERELDRWLGVMEIALWLLIIAQAGKVILCAYMLWRGM